MTAAKCQLLGVFGWSVQFCIATWCVAVLVFMWRIESPRRPCYTWFLDCSKQMVGAGWGHFMNIFWALICGKVMKTDEHKDQCVWYLVGFVSDIIICTFLCWLANTLLRPVFVSTCGIDIGDYEGAPPEESQDKALVSDAAKNDSEEPGCPWRMWLIQTSIWLSIMTSIKVVVCVICYLLQDHFYTWIAMGFVYVGASHNAHAQLVISVIIVPVIGDALQFAVQDTFLKRNDKPPRLSQYDAYAAVGSTSVVAPQ